MRISIISGDSLFVCALPHGVVLNICARTACSSEKMLCSSLAICEASGDTLDEVVKT